MNIQAYILTLTYHTTFEEIIEHIENCGADVITEFNILHMDDIVSYVAPKWATDGDVVFFYYAKSSINTIRKLKKECSNFFNSEEERKAMNAILINAEKIYSLIGGCIFAVGRVCGNAEIGEKFEHSHFRNNIFAPVTDFVNLETVIPLEYFSEYAPLEFKKSITPILGESFEQLKNDILEDCYINYLAYSHSAPVPLKDISADNWMGLNMDYRRKYFLEIQFRKYYVDFFLKQFGDLKKIYAECACYKGGKRSGIADNCIKFNGKYVFIEVKLNVDAVCDFLKQLEKYCNVEKAKLLDDEKAEKDDIVQNFVFVIDTKGFYIYQNNEKEIQLVEDLDNLKSISDIKKLKEKCITIIGH